MTTDDGRLSGTPGKSKYIVDISAFSKISAFHTALKHLKENSQKA
jgi:hypothetical protein